MSFFPYFVCALLGVDSLRGGLAKGNRILNFKMLRPNLCEEVVLQNGFQMGTVLATTT